MNPKKDLQIISRQILQSSDVDVLLLKIRTLFSRYYTKSDAEERYQTLAHSWANNKGNYTAHDSPYKRRKLSGLLDAYIEDIPDEILPDNKAKNTSEQESKNELGSIKFQKKSSQGKTTNQKNPARKKMKNTCKIFISFSHEDEFVVKSFVKNILIGSLKFKESEIFFTAGTGSKPKSGKDFKDAIKESLINAKLVIQFISKNYKESEVCLNEMGAAWVLCDTVVPILIEESFDVGFLNASKQQIKLSQKIEIKKFLQDHKNLLNPKEFKLDIIEENTDAFLNDFKKDEVKRKEKAVRQILEKNKRIAIDEFQKITGIEKIDTWDAKNAIIGDLKLKFVTLNMSYLEKRS